MSQRTSVNWKRLGAVAAFGLALVACREFYGRSIAPLRQRETEIVRNLADLKGRIDAARTTVTEIRAQEKNGEAIRRELNKIQRNSPPGVPIVWVPELMQQHFSRFGFADSTTRHNSTIKEPHLPGYRRIYWCVALPLRDVPNEIGRVLDAVAELEQTAPLIRGIDLTTIANPDDLGRSTAAVTFSTLVRVD